jgi:Bacterial regulatory helix-turn-helix protein, lysR family
MPSAQLRGKRFYLILSPTITWGRLMTRRLPSLNGLRAFEAAGRHGSFTAAAQELNVTQAAVSRMVRLLEQRLGYALFRRHANTLELTAQGLAFLSGQTDSFDSIFSRCPGDGVDGLAERNAGTEVERQRNRRELALVRHRKRADLRGIDGDERRQRQHRAGQRRFYVDAIERSEGVLQLRATRVGEHSPVVWKVLYMSPFFASSKTAKLMVFKLVNAAAKTWRRLKGENQLPKVVQGIKFQNGIEVIEMPAHHAA